jgi:hypothetical protein
MKKFSLAQFVNSFSRIIVILIFLFISNNCSSQNVGISATGALTPNASAGLDINYISQGFLIPRVALTGTAYFAPLTAHVAGMVVYNTATVADVSPGLYFNNGTKWIATQTNAATSGDMQFWNGTQWVNLPIGTQGQKLVISVAGIPSWGP